MKKSGETLARPGDVSAAKVDRDPQVARSRAERVDIIGRTHLLNPNERRPSCDLDVLPYLAAPGLDGRRAGRRTWKLGVMPKRSRQWMARLCIDVWVTVDGSVKRFDVAITSTDTRASDGVAIATGAQAPFSVHGKGF